MAKQVTSASPKRSINLDTPIEIHHPNAKRATESLLIRDVLRECLRSTRAENIGEAVDIFDLLKTINTVESLTPDNNQQKLLKKAGDSNTPTYTPDIIAQAFGWLL